LEQRDLRQQLFGHGLLLAERLLQVRDVPLHFSQSGIDSALICNLDLVLNFSNRLPRSLDHEAAHIFDSLDHVSALIRDPTLEIRTPLLHLSTRRRRALLSLTLLARFEETEFLLIALAPPFIERVLLTDGRTDKTFKLFARSFCHARHQAPVVSHAM